MIPHTLVLKPGLVIHSIKREGAKAAGLKPTRNGDRACTLPRELIAAGFLIMPQRRVFNGSFHSKRHSDAPRRGMDADYNRAGFDRYLLLHLRWNQAVRADSLQYDGTYTGRIAHPVSACQCVLRVASRVCLRCWPCARPAYATLCSIARRQHDCCDRD